jgi:hypothetical protein
LASVAGYFVAGKAEREDGSGLALEVAALVDGDEKQAGPGGGGFNGGDKIGLQISGHFRGILTRRSVHPHSKGQAGEGAHLQWEMCKPNNLRRSSLPKI